MQRGSLSPCPQWLPPSSLRDVAYPRTQLDQRARLHQFFHLSRIACSPSSASAYQCQPQLLWCPARQGAGINGGWPAAIHLSPAKSNISSCPARTFGPGSGRTWRLPTTCAGEQRSQEKNGIQFIQIPLSYAAMHLSLCSPGPIWGPSLDKSSYFPGLQSHSSAVWPDQRPRGLTRCQLNNCGTSQHEALTILSRSFSSFTWASFATRIDTTNDVLRILGDKQGHWTIEWQCWPNWNTPQQQFCWPHAKFVLQNLQSAQ